MDRDVMMFALRGIKAHLEKNGIKKPIVNRYLAAGDPEYTGRLEKIYLQGLTEAINYFSMREKSGETTE
jgi:hypothetical protein